MANNRRSLGAAMEMTPAKMAFIKGDKGVKPFAAPAPETPRPTESKLQPEHEATALTETREVTESASKPIKRSSKTRSVREAPQTGEILNQVLVPVTIRLPHRTAQALRRAYLEQKLRHSKPDTQQEIVEEALGDWLKGQGFLD